MRLISLFIILSILWCSPKVLSSNSDDDTEEAARKVIASSIESSGGQNNLKKYAHFSIKTKGVTYQFGSRIPFTAEYYWQLDPVRLRIGKTFSVNNETHVMVVVLDGDKGWGKKDNETKALSEEMVRIEKDLHWATWVAKNLSPTLDRAKCKLSYIGESEDKSALGVRVSRKGAADFELFFDKKTKLLTVIKSKASTDRANDTDQLDVYSRYKEINGVMVPHARVSYVNGKKDLEDELVEFKFVASHSASLFEKPK